MRSKAFLQHCSSLILLHFTGAFFPEDPEPINIVPVTGRYTGTFPVFLGKNQAGESPETMDRLDIQLLKIIDRTLYIGAKDYAYSVGLDIEYTKDIYFSDSLSWKVGRDGVDNCLIRGKPENECHNFIKVLLRKNDETLLICGTYAANPYCRYFKMNSLEPEGEPIKGHGRCPYNYKDGNIALFSDGDLYSATASDFMGLDAVIYRSLGDRPRLRTVKQDSRWLEKPYFVHAVELHDYIYFFFREVSVEHLSVGKVIVSRVARVCKNDMGGTMAVLENEWTSFLKARLECSVPGDSPFHFDMLHSVTDVVSLDGMDVVLATFSTPANSIPGSAVCAFDMATVDQTFAGQFKEQKSSVSIWTAVPVYEVPTPRPGSCAGSASLKGYISSNAFPLNTLLFSKTHTLMDKSVPSIAFKPWFQRTVGRDRLTKIIADSTAGPSQDYTVVFVGSEKGKIMKFLAMTKGSHFPDGSLFLEEMSIYNPEKCKSEGLDDTRIIAMELDKQRGALYVAFPNCIIRAPLGNCERHGACKKACIASRDPYCGWVNESCMHLLPGAPVKFEQDILNGNTDGLEDC
ncbi:semaphorin-6A-like [Hemicordylus capensis]|uniref:semaphorin-6A-like n=1 Tax=Hemicordylus capensis TaxID=884348 RepID=UPI00230209C2|nr:semaphorin-6A-like [Hemicordylus capensis]